MAEELKKLEELFQMGFISEAEFQSRRAALGFQGEEVKEEKGKEEKGKEEQEVGKEKGEKGGERGETISLDLTEDNVVVSFSDALLDSFHSLQQRQHENVYLVSLSEPVEASDEISLCKVPQGQLSSLLSKIEVPHDEIMKVEAELEKRHVADTLYFVSSDHNILDIGPKLRIYEGYRAGDIARQDVILFRGPTGLEPMLSRLFQMCNIDTKINRGRVEVASNGYLLREGCMVTEEARQLIDMLNINLSVEVTILFIKDGITFIPAVDIANGMIRAMNVAVSTIAEVGEATHWPVTPRVPSLVRNAFMNVLALSTSLSDSRVMELNKDYVASFTSYREHVEDKANQQKELQEIENSIKPRITELEDEIQKLKEGIAVFEDEYKNIKANFEDQDFNFAGLQLSVTPFQEQVLVAPGEGKKVIPVLIETKIGQAPDTGERIPFNLAIILDRSGSMQGEKLDNSKKAIYDIIDHMVDDDVMHLIIYDDIMETIFLDGKKSKSEFLKEKVKAVWARNNTNISGGLERARDAFASSSSKHHKRAFLFSDGQANAGLTMPAMLGNLARDMQMKHQIITSTFGIGSDFNFEIMDTIARNGRGTYFFIDEGKNIPKLVEKGLRGLTSLLATDACLNVRSLDPRVTVNKVYGQQGAPTKIMLGDLRYGDLKQTLLEITVDSGFTEIGDVPVLEIELEFTSQEQENGSNFLPAGTIQRRLSLSFSRDKAKVANQEPHYEVEVTRVIKESADWDALALSRFKNNNTDEAIKYKKLKMTELQRVSYHDRYGFTRVLLQKTRKSLLEFMLKALQDNVNRYNSAISEVNFRYARKLKEQTNPTPVYASAHAAAAKSSALFTKELEYEALEDECDDMGFGLFD